MTEINYKYEVAFSFLQQDELIAFDINNQISNRLSTFIYSNKQEELGGTDGERKFNEVFYKSSRIVVVLYRDGWGTTPWTRIEETAIKNRAFDNGWDFFVLVNLDCNSSLPTWIPKSYIWLDFERFKTKGASAIIEQKVKEKGGQVRPETIKDKTNKLKRIRLAEKEREEFLHSPDAIQTASIEIKNTISKLKEIKEDIEDPATNLHLGMRQRGDEMYEFGFGNIYLCFNYSSPINFGDGKLKVSLYEKKGHLHFNYEEQIIMQSSYRFDRDLIRNNGWCNFETGQDFLTTTELIDYWVDTFLKDIEKQK